MHKHGALFPDFSVDIYAHALRGVAAAFQQRRKTIRNALSRLMPPEAIEAAGISLGARPEVLSTADYVALTCEAARIVPPAQSS